MHPLPLPPCSDDPRAPQIRQVPANLRLVRLEGFYKETNADFICTQQVQQLQTGAVSQCAKEQFLIKSLRFPAHLRILARSRIYVLTHVPGPLDTVTHSRRHILKRRERR